MSRHRTFLHWVATITSLIILLPLVAPWSGARADSNRGAVILAKATAVVDAKHTVQTKGYTRVATWINGEGGRRRLYARIWSLSSSTVPTPGRARVSARIRSNFTGPVVTEQLDAIVRARRVAYRVPANGRWQCNSLSAFVGTAASWGSSFGSPGLGQRLSSVRLVGGGVVLGKAAWKVKAAWLSTLTTGKEAIQATFFVDKADYLVRKEVATASGKLSGFKINAHFSVKVRSYGKAVKISWPRC